jgi:hypothetical protein
MREDLLDAQATVDWAVAQIPIFQNAFLEWNQDPYELVKESDSDGSGYAIVAHQRIALPLTFNAWAGAMVNSLRTALDLLAASLAKRNGKKPPTNTYFPSYPSEAHMIDPLKGIECIKWLSERQRTAIKSLKPYRGGDYTIRPLNELDNLRKHERLISARADISGFNWTSGDDARPRMIWGGAGGIGMQRLENKAILYRSKTADGFDPTKGNTKISAFIAFNETRLLPLVKHDVAAVLLRFAERVAEIIGLFDPYGDVRDLLHPKS